MTVNMTVNLDVEPSEKLRALIRQFLHEELLKVVEVLADTEDAHRTNEIVEDKE